MFLVKVIAGHSHIAKKSEPDSKRPPCISHDKERCTSCKMNGFFDSVMGTHKTVGGKATELMFREMITYEKKQTYPAYLVTYNRKKWDLPGLPHHIQQKEVRRTRSTSSHTTERSETYPVYLVTYNRKKVRRTRPTSSHTTERSETYPAYLITYNRKKWDVPGLPRHIQQKEVRLTRSTSSHTTERSETYPAYLITYNRKKWDLPGLPHHIQQKEVRRTRPTSSHTTERSETYPAYLITYNRKKWDVPGLPRHIQQKRSELFVNRTDQSGWGCLWWWQRVVTFVWCWRRQSGVIYGHRLSVMKVVNAGLKTYKRSNADWQITQNRLFFYYAYVTIVPLCWNSYAMLTQRCVCNAVIVTTTYNGSVNVFSVYHVYINVHSI